MGIEFSVSYSDNQSVICIVCIVFVLFMYLQFALNVNGECFMFQFRYEVMKSHWSLGPAKSKYVENCTRTV